MSAVSPSSGRKVARSRNAFTANISVNPHASTASSRSTIGVEIVAGVSTSTAAKMTKTNPLPGTAARTALRSGHGRLDVELQRAARPSLTTSTACDGGPCALPASPPSDITAWAHRRDDRVADRAIQQTEHLVLILGVPVVPPYELPNPRDAYGRRRGTPRHRRAVHTSVLAQGVPQRVDGRAGARDKVGSCVDLLRAHHHRADQTGCPDLVGTRPRIISKQAPQPAPRLRWGDIAGATYQPRSMMTRASSSTFRACSKRRIRTRPVRAWQDVPPAGSMTGFTPSGAQGRRDGVVTVQLIVRSSRHIRRGC